MVLYCILFQILVTGCGDRNSGDDTESHDPLTPEQRSRLMALVRSKDTRPEMRVRRMLHAMGYRYRLHRKDLPGRPDIVFGPRKKVIFVHGCFWHGHKGCPRHRIPKSRRDFWESKLMANMERDARTMDLLTRMGWRILVVWECWTVNIEGLRGLLRGFLEDEE